ncbi:MAG: GNAT family N-acetyltransferase [Cellulomonas sp.]
MGDPDGAPWGAAWARTFPPDDPGYGYVAEDVPELGMAVLPAWRGRGVGRALLGAVLDQARTLGRPAMSLSVEDGNDVARALYVRRGFRVVGREGSSDTMLLTW